MVTRQFKIENEHNLMEYKMADRKTYSGFFSSIQPKDLNNFDLASPSQPNIFVITLDEASSGHIQRKLPKSWEYLLNEMKSQVYPFYAAILDQSVENINSMLTGEFRIAKNLSTIRKHRKKYVIFLCSILIHYLYLFVYRKQGNYVRQGKVKELVFTGSWQTLCNFLQFRYSV